MGTGETVAVKQIKLADLPKSELRVIMVSDWHQSFCECVILITEVLQLEIDLLKNLDVRQCLAREHEAGMLMDLASEHCEVSWLR